jgi:hypothetical protein
MAAPIVIEASEPRITARVASAKAVSFVANAKLAIRSETVNPTPANPETAT